MNTVAIIQARMGSSRLPGKTLMDLGGESVLSRVVKRVRLAAKPSLVVVATTNLDADQAIQVECDRLNVECFCGSEHDVLDRYYQTSLLYAADLVVRVTADCPVIDPQVVDDCIALMVSENFEYAANDVPNTFARGLDVEVLTADALKRAWHEAKASHEREHVTPYFYESPGRFRTAILKSDVQCDGYRWTLDTAEDLTLLGRIYEDFHPRNDFGWREIVALMQRQPELLDINACVSQKTVQSR